METMISRFWSKVEKTNSCWIWHGSLLRGGYGRFSREHTQTVLAHRMAWEITRGKIPDGLCVCHTCDNRKCVNPSHLFLATIQENTKDRDRKNRQARGSDIAKGAIKRMGENNGRAKLTTDDIAEIRARWKGGKITQDQLAFEYGVGQAQIWRIIRHWQWNNLTYCNH